MHLDTGARAVPHQVSSLHTPACMLSCCAVAAPAAPPPPPAVQVAALTRLHQLELGGYNSLGALASLGTLTALELFDVAAHLPGCLSQLSRLRWLAVLDPGSAARSAVRQHTAVASQPHSSHPCLVGIQALAQRR